MLTESSSPGNSLTRTDGWTFTLVLSPQLPEDLFLPLGGLLKTFLFLESSDVVGALSLSNNDTTGLAGVGTASADSTSD